MVFFFIWLKFKVQSVKNVCLLHCCWALLTTLLLSLHAIMKNLRKILDHIRAGWFEKRVWVWFLPNIRAFFANLVNFYSIYTRMPCNRLSELSKMIGSKSSSWKTNIEKNLPKMYIANFTMRVLYMNHVGW